MTRGRIWVTGSCRGIGQAVAEAFAAAGDKVAIHHRDSAGLAADVVAGLSGEGHVVVQGDIADPGAVRAMVDAAADRLGGLDVLVNNAASYGRRGHPIGEISYQQWQEGWHPTTGLNPISPANPPSSPPHPLITPPH